MSCRLEGNRWICGVNREGKWNALDVLLGRKLKPHSHKIRFLSEARQDHFHCSTLSHCTWTLSISACCELVHNLGVCVAGASLSIQILTGAHRREILQSDSAVAADIVRPYPIPSMKFGVLEFCLPLRYYTLNAPLNPETPTPPPTKSRHSAFHIPTLT